MSGKVNEKAHFFKLLTSLAQKGPKIHTIASVAYVSAGGFKL